MMNSKRMVIVLVLVLVLTSVTSFLGTTVQAADGDLDPSFGTGGRVPAGVSVISFGADSCAASDTVYALGKQSVGGNAGKIIVAGVTGAANTDWALARLDTNGMLDTTFGAGMTGKVTTDLTTSDQLNDVAVDSDDKIVAVGAVASMSDTCGIPGGGDSAIAKYNADGTLDTSFNGTGKLTFDAGGFLCRDLLKAVVIQPDHKIVVTGFADKPGMGFPTAFVFLARLNTDGTFDSTFNGGNMANTSGVVTFDTSMTGIAFSPNDMVIIPSGPNAGKFITAGGFADMQVVRFNTDGSLDTSFGSSGKSSATFMGGSDAQSIALQSDGKILACGSTPSGGGDFAIARWNGDGTLDSAGFGSGGTQKIDFNMSNDSGHFVGVLSNGKIIVSGGVQLSPDNYLGIVRLNSDGSLDSGFGTGGKVLTHLGTNPNGVCGGAAPGMPVNNEVIVQTGALQSDGRVLAAGTINTAFKSDTDMFVARVQNTSIDCTLTCPGNITKSNDPNQCGAVVTFPNPIETGTTCSGTINCLPASGSFFPKGMTTVTCTDTSGPSCSFTVTINDTQNPTIACPANITANSGGSGSAVVNFAPTVNDNCPGVTGTCMPASGSSFPLGMTTVMCKAADTSSNMATCSFTVTVTNFNACLRNDATGDFIQWNSTTGDYSFTHCASPNVTLTGKGIVSVMNGIKMLTDRKSDRNISAGFNAGTLTGSAVITLTSFPGIYQTYRINDTNPHPMCSCGP